MKVRKKRREVERSEINRVKRIWCKSKKRNKGKSRSKIRIERKVKIK